MNDKIVFGQYYNSNSWIHQMDPRTKIIGIIILMVTMFIINSLYSLLIILGFELCLIISSKVPFDKFLNSLKTMSIVILIVFITQIIFRKGEVLLFKLDLKFSFINTLIIILLLALYLLSGKIIRKFRFLLFIVVIFMCFYIQYKIDISFLYNIKYTINIYQEGLIFSSFITIRIILLLLISSLLTLTTKPTELNDGLDLLLKPLKKIKINTSIFTMMISIALRFIPTLLNEANKILKAQASRGVDFKEVNLKEKITQIVSLIIPMLVIADKRADDLADAMEARGYDPSGNRTTLGLLKMRVVDVVSLIFVIGILIASIVLRSLYAL